MPLYDGNKQILTSKYGTGLNPKQKAANAWVLDPMVLSTETVEGGNGSSNAVALSQTKSVSFVTTATSKSHVSLPDGIMVGQVKKIIHKTRSNGVNLVITPANFAAGDDLTSNLGGRGIELIWDGSNWHVLGDVVEFEIDA